MLPPSPLAPERLTAVFIRHEDFRAFAESFSTVFENNDHSSKSDPSNELTGLGLRPFAGETTYQAELSHLIQSKYGISRAIEAASRAGVLLVLLYTSLDQVIDSISNAEILQLSLLAPESEANVGYFERWTRSKVFSVGSIRSVISPGSFSLSFPFCPLYPGYICPYSCLNLTISPIQLSSRAVTYRRNLLRGRRYFPRLYSDVPV